MLSETWSALTFCLGSVVIYYLDGLIANDYIRHSLAGARNCLRLTFQVHHCDPGLVTVGCRSA